MKRIITLTVIVVCTLCQIKAIDFGDDRGITASAFFGCSHYHKKITYGGYWESDDYHPVITPRIWRMELFEVSTRIPFNRGSSYTIQLF